MLPSRHEQSTVLCGVDFEGGRGGASLSDLAAFFPDWAFEQIVPDTTFALGYERAIDQAADSLLRLGGDRYIAVGYCAGARIAAQLGARLSVHAKVPLVVVVDGENTGPGDLSYALDKALSERAALRQSVALGKEDTWDAAVEDACRAIRSRQLGSAPDDAWAALVEEFTDRYRTFFHYLAMAAALQPAPLTSQTLLAVSSRPGIEQFDWPAQRVHRMVITSLPEHSILGNPELAQALQAFL
jgi:hypothetical protein